MSITVSGWARAILRSDLGEQASARALRGSPISFQRRAMPTAARRCADALWRAAQLLAGAVMAISFMTPAVRGEPGVLADPTLPLRQTWTHRRFVGASAYERTKQDGVAAIRADGRDYASGL